MYIITKLAKTNEKEVFYGTRGKKTHCTWKKNDKTTADFSLKMM